MRGYLHGSLLPALGPAIEQLLHHIHESGELQRALQERAEAERQARRQEARLTAGRGDGAPPAASPMPEGRSQQGSPTTEAQGADEDARICTRADARGHTHTHTHMSVLGPTVASDGSTRPDWARARAAMWRSFYRCCASKAAKSLPCAKKRALLRTAVRPVLDFYSTRWALATRLLADVDRAQRRMVAILLGCAKSPESPPRGSCAGAPDRRVSTQLATACGANGVRGV